MSQKEYKYKINGINFSVVVDDPVDNTVHVEVNGVPYTVELEKAPGVKKTVSQPVKRPPKDVRNDAGEKVVVKPVAPVAGGYVVKAPLPGTIMSLPVKVGDKVTNGQTVCVLEAMKMENDIHTPKGGTVKEILVNIGDAVPQDGNIMILE
ncbi:MAG: acetyl-CoA carboxylase biotin carboxyl carrier protein subunit [Muribaculaceae bacterium]|nr:acetyl-CoA carboxylase biotin carboxyl carrier protein subunit [Muribaculaceae bacterium]